MDSDTEQRINDDQLEIKHELSENVQQERSGTTGVENNSKNESEPSIRKEYHNLWTSNATSCLIGQYKKYRNMVGQSLEIRSLRDMFEKISAQMRRKGFYFTPQKCENKWRVLERKYKNLVVRETLRRPGRIKHYGNWEHKRALDEIFNERRKSSYLQEVDYIPVDKSNNCPIALPEPIRQANNNVEINDDRPKLRKKFAESRKLCTVDICEDPLTSNALGIESEEILSKETITSCFSTFIKEVQKQFEILEKNNERRHREEMAIRKSELEVQQRLLKLKEQKFDLEKKKIITIAQNI